MTRPALIPAQRWPAPFLAVLLLTVSSGCPNHQTNSPPTEETPSTGTPDLRAELHAEISAHRVLNYRELWDALAYTDEDPARPGHVLLLYTGWSRSAEDHGNGASQ